MAHLAKDASVWASDPLDGKHRAIGIDAHVHAWRALLIYILRGDLSSAGHMLDNLITCYKAAFSVADCHIVYVTDGAL